MPNPEFPFPPQGMPSYEQLLHDRQSLAQQLQAERKANMAMLSNGLGLQDMVAKRAFAEQQSAWDQLRAPTAMGTGIPLFPNMYMRNMYMMNMRYMQMCQQQQNQWYLQRFPQPFDPTQGRQKQRIEIPPENVAARPAASPSSTQPEYLTGLGQSPIIPRPAAPGPNERLNGLFGFHPDQARKLLGMLRAVAQTLPSAERLVIETAVNSYEQLVAATGRMEAAARSGNLEQAQKHAAEVQSMLQGLWRLLPPDFRKMLAGILHAEGIASCVVPLGARCELVWSIDGPAPTVVVRARAAAGNPPAVSSSPQPVEPGGQQVPYTPPVELQGSARQSRAPQPVTGFWRGAFHGPQGEVVPAGEGQRLLGLGVPYEYRYFYDTLLTHTYMPASVRERTQRIDTLRMAESIGRLLPQLLEGHTAQEGRELLAQFNTLSRQFTPRLRSHHQQAFIDAIQSIPGLHLTLRDDTRWVIDRSTRSGGSSGRGGNSAPANRSGSGTSYTSLNAGSNTRPGSSTNNSPSGSGGRREEGGKTAADSSSTKLDAESKKTSAELKNLQDQLQKSETDTNARRNSLDDFEKQLAQLEVTRKEQRLKVQEARSNAAKARAESAEYSKQLQEQRKKLDDELTQGEKQLAGGVLDAKTFKQVTARVVELIGLIKTNQQLRDSNLKVLEERAKGLEAGLESLLTEVEVMEKQVTKLETQRSELTKEFTQLQDQVKKLRDQRDQLEKKRGASTR